MVGDGHWPGPTRRRRCPASHGIPLTNFAGWLLVGALMMLVLVAVLPRDDPHRPADEAVPAVLLVWTWLGYVAGQRVLVRHRTSVALVGGIAIGLLVLPYAWVAVAVAALTRGGRRGSAPALAVAGAGAHRVEPAPAARRRRPTRRRSPSRSPCCCRCATRRTGSSRACGRCWRRPASATCGCWCSTTARPTAPPTSYAGSRPTTRGVQLLDGAALPDGWWGKPWACHQLAEAARRRDRAGLRRRRRRPGAARGRGVGRAAAVERAGPGVAVPAAGRGVRGRAARAAAAAVVVAHDAAAAGGRALGARVAGRRQRPAARGRRGCLPTQPAGTRAVRDAMLEDVALLRAVKRSGGRGSVVDGTRLATCRMYDGWADAARGLREVAVVGVRLPRRCRRGRRGARRRLRRAAARGAARVAGRPGRATPPGWPGGCSLPGVPGRGSGRTASRTRCRSRRSAGWSRRRCAGTAPAP